MPLFRYYAMLMATFYLLIYHIFIMLLRDTTRLCRYYFYAPCLAAAMSLLLMLPRALFATMFYAMILMLMPISYADAATP